MATTLIVIILAAIVLMTLLLLILTSVSSLGDRLQQQLFAMVEHEGQIDAQTRAVGASLEEFDRALAAVADRLSGESLAQVQQLRDESAAGLRAHGDALQQQLTQLSLTVHKQQASFQQYLEQFNASLERVGRVSAEEATRTRSENSTNAVLMREELTKNLKASGDVLLDRVVELTAALHTQHDSFHQQMSHFADSSERRMTELQQVFDRQLGKFEGGVDARLAQMRAAVDEQVQLTMQRGLGDSFLAVRQQLETVQRNLGEMQSLASNVSDLRRVLTNVSNRGNWGVARLSSLLEQILSADQYAADVKTKRGSDERVRFAVRLPGRESTQEAPVWLPIDAGFPLGLYRRLIDARDGADAAEVEAVGAALESSIKARAASVRDKFLDPPLTTEFAIMFLPVEGLYAEVLRRQGLAEELQRESHVVVTGPATLVALLNSLQMGFRTLVIEQRSMEVWHLLAEVKTQFDRFGHVLSAVQAKLQEASSTISTVETHAKEMQERLSTVRELTADEAPVQLASAALPAVEPAATGAPGQLSEPEPEDGRGKRPPERPPEPTETAPADATPAATDQQV